MSILGLISIIALFGGIGDLANCFQTGEPTFFPSRDEESKVPRPGWLGAIFIGSVAAVAVWGMYGPLASFDIINGDTTKASVTIGQLCGSLVIGFSGGKVLTLIAQHKADQIAKNELANASKKLVSRHRKKV